MKSKNTPTDSDLTLQASALDRELLREILAELRGIRAALERGRRGGETEADVVLFSAIVKNLRHEGFRAVDVIDTADLDDADGLQAAIKGACGNYSAGAVGKFLGRMVGREIHSLRIEQAGQDREGVVWCVRRCGD